jgi:choline dehydrogenase-like flavoprotein
VSTNTPEAPHSVDVVVVGSGPAGASVARELRDRDPSLHIVIVEGGPLITEPPGRHIKTIVDDAQRGLAQLSSQGIHQAAYEDGLALGPAAAPGSGVRPRPGLYLLGPDAVQPNEHGMPAAAMSSNVGGMGAHWSCACPRPGGSEIIPFIPQEELEDVLTRAEELLSVTSDAFRDAPLSDRIRSSLSAVYDQGRHESARVQPMPLAVRVTDDDRRYWVGPDVVLGDILTRAQNPVELRANTIVRRVLVEEGRASGVVAHDRATASDYVLHARAVVVACDALRTPQLLFASGVRPEALGRYLNDQPQVVGLVRIRPELIPQGPAPSRADAGQVEQFSGVTWIPFWDEDFPFHGQIVQMDASPIAIQVEEDAWPGSYVGVGLFGHKDLQMTDRVALSDTETDHFGLPAMRIHYDLTARDLEHIEAMKSEVLTIMAAIGEPVGAAEPILLPAGSSLHYQGSVRMGPSDDGTSVCDPQGRVWGTENLYVAGNGVIPTSTACNPTLTGVALGVRTARSIAAALSGENDE